MNRPGTLIVRPICGKLLRDTDFLTKMDPYCVVTCGSQRQKTRIASGAGKNPSWSDQLVFKKSYEDMLQISVFDYDGNSRDDLVGEGSISIARITSTPTWEDWVEVNYKGRRAGEVRLSVSFTPEGGNYAQPGYGAPQHGQPTVVYVNVPQPGYPAVPPQAAYPAYPPGYQGGPPPSYPAYPPAYPAYPPSPAGFNAPQPMYNPQPGYNPPQPGYGQYPPQPNPYQGYPGYPPSY